MKLQFEELIQQIQNAWTQKKIWDQAQLNLFYQLKKLTLQLSAETDQQKEALIKLSRLPEPKTIQDFMSFVVLLQRHFLHSPGRQRPQQDRERTTHRPLPLVVVLDSIRSAHNLGSMIRTAECMGVERIVLTGYTCEPTASAVEKTALGTQNWIEFQRYPSLAQALKDFKEQGHTLLGLELSDHSQKLNEFDFPLKSVLVVGNERHGISPSDYPLFDALLEIEMFGRKNSLNAVQALAIASFAYRNQH